MPEPVSTFDQQLYGEILRDSYSVSRPTVQRRTEPVSGPARFRRVLEDALLVASIELIQDAAQFAAFEAWHDADIRGGADWFNIDLHIGTAPRTVVAHFVGPYRYQIIGRGLQHARTAFELELFERVPTAFDHADPTRIDGGSPAAPSPSDDRVDAGRPSAPSPAGDRIWGGGELGLPDPG